MAGVFFYLTRFVLSGLNMRKHKQGRFHSTAQEQDILQEIKDRLHISRPIELYHGYNVDSPFSTNILKPTIYLTAKEYDPDELRVVLTHELYHIKYHDIFWKPAFYFVCCIFWFNPLTWNLAKQFRRWTEANCDNHCYEDHFTEDEYASVIIHTMRENPQYVNLFASNWCENKSDILWRFTLMQDCIGNQWKSKVSITLIIIIITACVGLTAVIDYGMEKLYYYAFSQSQSITVVDNPVEEPGNTENIGQYNDMDQWAMNMDYMLTIDANGDSNYVYVQIKESELIAGQRMRTEFFHVESGDEIRLSIGTDVSDQLLQVGIVDETGHYWAVQGYNEVAYTLNCPNTGDYAMYVENTSFESAIIRGICLIRHPEK
ncbi:MAG: M56 family metallopeptidase [Lachnospiraceae bacterium]|nr:M56 family metallopeptidase [Lachnospiraceae bacterium]